MIGLPMSWLSHALVFAASLAGFALLSLAMARHQQDLFDGELRPATSRILRVAGWLMLIAGLSVAVRFQGWGFGLVAYGGHTSMAAWLVLIALVFLNRRRGAGR